MVISQRTERLMVTAMCGAQLINRRSKDLMFMLGMNETIHHLAMAECLLVWSYAEERGWACLEKRIRIRS